jgi:hypothetical protein
MVNEIDMVTKSTRAATAPIVKAPPWQPDHV